MAEFLAFLATVWGFLSWSVRWFLRLLRLARTAIGEAEALARKRIEKRLKFLEERLKQEEDPERKLGLEREVKKAREELIGYDVEISERTLKRANLPALDKLAEIGRKRLASDGENVNQNDSSIAKKA